MRVFLNEQGPINFTSIMTTKVGDNTKSLRYISRDRDIPTMEVAAGPPVTAEHLAIECPIKLANKGSEMAIAPSFVSWARCWNNGTLREIWRLDLLTQCAHSMVCTLSEVTATIYHLQLRPIR